MKVNERPFELVGFTYNDYKRWCKKFKKKENVVTNKKEFFDQVYSKRLVKSSDDIYLDNNKLD